ncbi:hypothetical protein WJX73_006532 [Symbiochloris irregularis]|uniref:PA domain-containing protein n=1 Tax=Symbiochloris irregularis TaxID=706552 RepID=A0AAW1NQD7_9CHLO
MRSPAAFCLAVLGITLLSVRAQPGKTCPGAQVAVRTWAAGKPGRLQTAYLAPYGLPLPRTESAHLPLPLSIAQPRDGCAPLDNSMSWKGSAVLVERGACVFTDKALNVAQAQAAAMIVYNNETGCLILGGEQQEGGLDILVASVTQAAIHHPAGAWFEKWIGQQGAK